jgi:hypothetical protein
VRRYCAPSQVERCSRMGAAISGRPLCYPQVTRPSRQTRRSLCDQGIRHVYAEKSSESDCMFALRQPLRHVNPQPIGRRIIGTYRSASAFRKEEAKLRGLRGSRLAFSLASRCSLPASVGHLVVAVWLRTSQLPTQGQTFFAESCGPPVVAPVTPHVREIKESPSGTLSRHRLDSVHHVAMSGHGHEEICREC